MSTWSVAEPILIWIKGFEASLDTIWTAGFGKTEICISAAFSIIPKPNTMQFSCFLNGKFTTRIRFENEDDIKTNIMAQLHNISSFRYVSFNQKFIGISVLNTTDYFEKN